MWGYKGSTEWFAVDVSIATENLVLAATNEGLSTCWVGSFNEAEVKTLLNIPEHFAIIALITVGYGREKFSLTRSVAAAIRGRKKLEDIVSIEEYDMPPTFLLNTTDP